MRNKWIFSTLFSDGPITLIAPIYTAPGYTKVMNTQRAALS